MLCVAALSLRPPRGSAGRSAAAGLAAVSAFGATPISYRAQAEKPFAHGAVQPAAGFRRPGLAVIPLRGISVGFFCPFRFCLVICFSGCVCGSRSVLFFPEKSHLFSSRHAVFIPPHALRWGTFPAQGVSFAALAGVYLRFPCPGLSVCSSPFLPFHFLSLFPLFLSAALAVSGGSPFFIHFSFFFFHCPGPAMFQLALPFPRFFRIVFSFF